MISSSNNISSHPQSDRLWVWGLRCSSWVAGGILSLILIFLVFESLPALHHIGPVSFFKDAGWHPTERLYLLTPMILGTLWATGGAILLATPLGILSALFCHYFAPPFLSTWYRRLIELLAGIPSVVYGLWGLVVLVPMIAQYHPPGPSLLAGILVLTLMILPTIMLIAHSSLAQVPFGYVQNATALGLGRLAIIRRVILPTAKAGLMTGILLGVARALGETMAILMVCGNVVQNPSHLFDPIRTLTSNIAIEMAYALGDHRSALFVSGLLLMGMVVLFVILSEWIHSRARHETTT